MIISARVEVPTILYIGNGSNLTDQKVLVWLESFISSDRSSLRHHALRYRYIDSYRVFEILRLMSIKSESGRLFFFNDTKIHVDF